MQLAFPIWLIITFCAADPFPHAVPPHSSDPVIQALVENDVSVALSLLDSGADADGFEVITPLYAAQEYVKNTRQRHKIMRRLLRLGAGVDRPTLDGSTTLMLAAQHGDFRSAEILLEHGADPLRANEHGYNAIGIAEESGNADLADQLREHVGESGLRRMADYPHAEQREL
mmetsp:Transcript_40163/g.66667  ORF Transcript_40163/g.66667 Transcript_40163/m.66667 type:complete len:172 (+) Transcript_40163:1-516(+)